ncbi:TetR/AcrR family transcriptional regulator (plasmid) [Nocardioides sp. R1-1]|uniref:TetR/AcrR family transcriptional regulator n=1 Tax=Nocardioides sp. R1-1 TaxID=3383502 RepID=UPI0038D1A4E1
MAEATIETDGSHAEDDWRIYPDLPLHPILAAALDHFQEHGYHGTTVRNIATGVGQTMPTLYYHYGSKEGILVALLNIAMDDLQMHIDRCLEEAGDDVLQRFENYITAVVLHYTNRRDLALLHSEFRFLGTEARAQYVQRRMAFEAKLEELIKDGIAEGIFDSNEDPHFSARVLLGMLGGILNRATADDWYSESGALSALEIARRYTHYAVRLVTPA